MTREELLAKIEAATGPNFQLECDIAVELEPRRIAAHPIPPNYTASIDAALGLVERLLGHAAIVQPVIYLGAAQQACSIALVEHEEPFVAENLRTPALAILAALLKALRALPPSNEAAR